MAQDRPSAELHIGFPLLFRDGSSQLFGIQGGMSVHARQWLGVTGDFAFHAGEVFADKSLFTALGGPVVSAKAGSRVRVFGHTLLGAATNGCGRFNNGCQSDAVFSHALGGGLQLQAGKRWNFRIAADDLSTRFGGSNQHYLRLSFAAVFPIGE
jgi:hypothetical protein